jgi:hypothetical protein
LRRLNWFIVLFLLLQAQVIAVRQGMGAHSDQRGSATSLSTLCSPDRWGADRFANDDCARIRCALLCESGYCPHPILDAGHAACGYSCTVPRIQSFIAEIFKGRTPLCGVIVGARAPPLFS